jgi:hypothetical protein
VPDSSKAASRVRSRLYSVCARKGVLYLYCKVRYSKDWVMVANLIPVGRSSVGAPNGEVGSSGLRAPLSARWLASFIA